MTIGMTCWKSLSHRWTAVRRNPVSRTACIGAVLAVSVIISVTDMTLGIREVMSDQQASASGFVSIFDFIAGGAVAILFRR